MTVFIAQQLVFVHVPKTAGTTIRSLLESRFQPDAVFPSERLIAEHPAVYQDIQVVKDILGKSKISTPLIRSHIPYHTLLPFLPDDPTTLTMLRHPVRRTLSELYHHKRHFEIELQNTPLEELLELHPERYKPQWTYFGASLEEAIQTLHRFDWVGIQERCEESIAFMFRCIGWPPVSSVPMLNRAPDELPPISTAQLDLLIQKTLDDMVFYAQGLEIFRKRYANI